MSRYRRTSPLTLVVLGAVGVVAGWLLRPLTELGDNSSPAVGWGAAITLAAGAVVVAAFAWNTWQSLHKRQERMTSDHAVKMLALAKAAAIAGALVCGGYVGYALVWFGDRATRLGSDRFWHSVVAALAAALLLVAGLLLERALRLPDDPDEQQERSRDPSRRQDPGHAGA